MHWKLNRDEEGVALVTVILSMFAILVLVASLMQYALGSQPLSRRDQDWNGSLAAAEAGIDDYIYRLNQDGNYWVYSKSNPPPDGNQAFSQAVPVPGPQTESTFFYTPDASKIKTDGTITLTVSGQIRGATRTLETTLRRRTFIDYLYFTDYETLDPALYTGVPFTPQEAQVKCAKHYYEGRDPQCTRIFFFDRDVIRGPLHSNDAINISGGPQFLGDTTTSWNDPSGKRWLGSGSPKFKNKGDPKFMPPLTMPPSNSALKALTNPLLGGTGCLYTGPTSIVLNSNGTMNVNSYFTKSSNCAKGNGVPLPENGVVYVQNVPSDPTDPNYTAGCPVLKGNPLGYPLDPPGTSNDDLSTYGCRDGDVFLEGTLKGRLTIAAEHNIVVTWHTQYAGGMAGNDLLGLVANNYVEVYHPVRCTITDQSSCNLNAGPNHPGSKFTNPIIQAAILSVQHSFRVQNYRAGSAQGKLNVTGAIAQKYRGIVGTFSGDTATSGYEKNYVYDQRLKYLSPPHFIDPVSSSWGVVTWEEKVPDPTP